MERIYISIQCYTEKALGRDPRDLCLTRFVSDETCDSPSLLVVVVGGGEVAVRWSIMLNVELSLF